MKKNFYHVKFEDEDAKSFFKVMKRIPYELTSIVITSLIGVTIVLTFLFRVATVQGDSMYPTLLDSDEIVITNFTSSYNRGDIVVIYRDDDAPLIKRIIAVEGDTLDIDFENGQVILNGEVLEEEYISEPIHNGFANGTEYPLTVPEGHVFVMGDNRNNSLDSRNPHVGFVDLDSVVGKMVVKLSGSNNQTEGY